MERAEAVDTEGASYSVDADQFPFMCIDDLEELRIAYDGQLKKCYTDTDAVLCFVKFVQDANDKKKELEEDLIQHTNEGRYWGDIGNGDIDPDEGY